MYLPTRLRALDLVQRFPALSLVVSATLLSGVGSVPQTAAAVGATQDVACSTSALLTAISMADSGSAPATLNLAHKCKYQLTEINNYWYGPNALPPISTKIVINGNGAAIVRDVSADLPNFRFFFIGADPSSPATYGWSTPGAGDLRLSNLTIAGGVARGGNGSGGGLGAGGAIFSQGALTLDDVTLTANHATGGDGGPYVGDSPDIGFTGGGGIGSDSTTTAGGGFGGPVDPINGQSTGNAQGGGGGFTAGDSASGAGGGGTATGTGGDGGVNTGGISGDGSGGAGPYLSGKSGSGGGFGTGGNGGTEAVVGMAGGGGGGVGGGGGAGAGGGGGGFGGGGGQGGAKIGGEGGFGGGGGAAVGTTGGYGGGDGDPKGDGGGGGGAGMGGAIFDQDGSLSITNSTLAGNAAEHGLGIDAAANGHGLGGAVFVLGGGSDPNHRVKITASTIASNFADDAGLYVLGFDASRDDGATVVLADDIVSGTETSQGTRTAVGDLTVAAPASMVPTSRSNLSGATVTLNAPSLIQRSSSLGAGQLIGTPISGDPHLALLGVNGGPGMNTMGFSAHSSAFERGTHCPTRDERGVLRTSPTCDLGAFEQTAPMPPVASHIVFSPKGPHHPRLAFTLNHGHLSYSLTRFVLTLPAGVTFSKLHRRIAKYLTIRRAGKPVKFTATVSKRRKLTIVFKTAEPKISLTVLKPEMTFSKSLVKKLTRRPMALRLATVRTLDTQGQTNTQRIALTHS
jgi:hypothetical protein